MLSVTVVDNRVQIGERFSVSFQRTLRIPDDGRTYPLPPGLGAFPVHRVADHHDRLPAAWRRDGVFIPMFQREALWLGFDGAVWKPNAVKIAAGNVNAISGDVWDETLHAEPQDYIVCPDQPWLDGINDGDGRVRQFVAAPLGSGYTIEAQVSGTDEAGGIQIVVFEPKSGRFPDHPPPMPDLGPEAMAMAMPSAGAAMGLAAGGALRQKIYPDPYGIDAWDAANRGAIFVHIMNAEQYRDVTGREPPPTTISSKTYTDNGLPWFDLYDESRASLAPPDSLSRVKSLSELDAERERSPTDADAPVDVPDSQIRKLRH